ncbi:MAG: NADH-ubiquinone oxidoreductase-F iron-sulfur binding region domain-containing protein [Solirubrobacteraceae bacterium]|jgi:NADH:ubiquinone oxidoreductase subunit F (NADH-binding)
MSLPRLLRGVGAGRMTYAAHVGEHGEIPDAVRRGGDGPAPPLLAELTRSGLRGHGGGGFPIAAKLDAVRRSKGTPVVVVNGTEGEPMSVKDRMLMESLPHLVLDGAICCAQVAGADKIVVALDQLSRDAAASVSAALRERPEFGRGSAPTEIISVPPGYVTGQETAVVNFLNTGKAKPMYAYPRISERGVGKRPTLMSNPETLAHVALIARHGAEWFRRLGSAEEPGSALVTLSGAIRAPGVYEIEYGSLLTGLVDAAEGQTEPLRAFLLGGYAGGWVDAGVATGARLSEASLRPAGASLGAGIIVALPRSACPVAEVTRVAGWMADESAGQCGPCVNGLGSIADTLTDLCEGHGGRDALADIRRWAGLVTGRGACAHPDGTARFVTSALSVFAAEFADHARHGLCDACARPPVLLTPQPRSAVR